MCSVASFTQLDKTISLAMVSLYERAALEMFMWKLHFLTQGSVLSASEKLNGLSFLFVSPQALST